MTPSKTVILDHAIVHATGPPIGSL